MSGHPLDDPGAAPIIARAALGAITTDQHPPSTTQHNLLDALARRFGRGAAVDELAPIAPDEVAQLLTDPTARGLLAHLVVVLELIEHPLHADVEAHAERYLAEAGITLPFVEVARDTARQQLALLHADIIRSSWTTEQTVHGIVRGKLLELVRSKLAYYGIGGDAEVAARWRGLGDCPDGSWGRAVFDFYQVHGFPFPGEPHGIYEVGALHDWVHVLADYATDAEGEIDVFAFIAATMEDPHGFVNFLFTLALFQNGTIDTVGGKKVAIARADTLDEPGAPDRLVDALYRASFCTEDVMGGVDHFALADESLDDLRSRWSIPPKGVEGRGAMDTPQPAAG